MVTRKRIGLLFKYNEDWVGGLYYILNIVKSLNTLPDDQKPCIVLFYSDRSPIEQVKQIHYPYIEYKSVLRPLNLFKRSINKLFRYFTNSNLYSGYYNAKLVEYIFPYGYEAELYSLNKLKKVYWIPDFQHKYMPEFFNKHQLNYRDKRFEQITEQNEILVLSSKAAYDDLKRFYPAYKNEVKILPFASVLPAIDDLEIDKVKEKYGIPGAYFILPNQFWPHKNHKIVLQAINILIRKNYNIHLVCTGKINKKSNTYFSAIETYVKEKKLQPYVTFTDFIDRREQLLLMKHAIAIIQPSLFEGWSTVVEDAKALHQFIILSDIPVHREQINMNCMHFNAGDAEVLCGLLEQALTKGVKLIKTDYQMNIRKFANEIMHLA